VPVAPAPIESWPVLIPPDIASEAVGQMAAAAELAANDVADCPLELELGEVETRPAVPKPKVPSPLVPSPLVPSPLVPSPVTPTAELPDADADPVVAVLIAVAVGALADSDEDEVELDVADTDEVELDVFVPGAAATPEAVTEKVAPAPHGFATLLCMPSELAALLCAPSKLAAPVCAPGELATLIGPKFNPPPSNVGSVAVLGLAPGHAVEFASADRPLAVCDLPAPVGLACNGDVACRLGMGGGMPVCATLTPRPTQGPASAIARARKPLIIRVCGFAMHSLTARSGSRHAALMRKASN
jgi:hypothetical protein